MHEDKIVSVNLIHAMFTHMASGVVRLEGGMRALGHYCELFKWRRGVGTGSQHVLGQQGDADTERGVE